MIQGLSYSYPADCWSFGVLIYELLNLERPFRGHTTSDLVKSILNDEPQPLASHYSEEIKQLTLSLLIKEPSQRLGMAGMLTHPYYISKVIAYPQSYRPKSLEERLKRAHAKQLTSQIEGLKNSKKSSLMPLSECIASPNSIYPTNVTNISNSLPPLLLPVLLAPSDCKVTSAPNSNNSENIIVENISSLSIRQYSQVDNKFPIL
jgi:serine/threonine protein kinase